MISLVILNEDPLSLTVVLGNNVSQISLIYFQPLFPGESAVDQLVEIIKVQF